MDNLTVGGKYYQLDTSGMNLDQRTRSIWVVDIRDENGHQVTVRRVSGTSEEVYGIAEKWLNDLCRRNPGALLQHVIRELKSV